MRRNTSILIDFHGVKLFKLMLLDFISDDFYTTSDYACVINICTLTAARTKMPALYLSGIILFVGLKNDEQVGLDIWESESDTERDDRHTDQRKIPLIYTKQGSISIHKYINYIPRVLRLLSLPPTLSSSDSESDSGTSVPCGCVGVCSKDRNLLLAGVFLESS